MKPLGASDNNFSLPFADGTDQKQNQLEPSDSKKPMTLSFHETSDAQPEAKPFDEKSKIGKLLNVVEAAALDLKTYSISRLESWIHVNELQQSLGTISQYIEMAHRELLQQLNIVQSDLKGAQRKIKHAKERKAHYKDRCR